VEVGVRGSERDMPSITNCQLVGNIGQTRLVTLTADSPNPLRVAWSIFRARRATPPGPHGTAHADHTGLGPVLQALAKNGISALAQVQDDLDEYLAAVVAVGPAALSRPEALAYWLSLHNAGALNLAARAFGEGADSILRVLGGFDSAVSGRPTRNSTRRSAAAVPGRGWGPVRCGKPDRPSFARVPLVRR
jgi:hypothetical protein